MAKATRLLISTAVAGLAATAAAAHPKLIASVPAANASVTAPVTIELKFNEAVVDQFSGIEVQVTDMTGMKMKNPIKMAARPSLSGDNGTRLTANFAKPLPKGGYKVTWHAVTADTHRVEGSYSFTVK